MRIPLNWDQTLIIGVDAMDREHRGLVDAMNEIEILHAKQAGKPTISRAVAKLARLTVEHFQAEERYLESIQYAELDVHKSVHKDLLTQLRRHQEAFEAGDGKVTDDFNNFLVCWLRAHIRGIDKKYARIKAPTAT